MDSVKILVAALLLGACSSDNGDKPKPPSNQWQIGPIIKGENYSKGCPLYFGSAFTIGPCEPHYVTRPTGSLIGKSRIRARFRLDANPAAIIHGAKCPTDSPSRVTLYFEEKNVNWYTDGYRWWASFARSSNLVPGMEFELVAPLDGPWRSVLAINAQDNPDVFAQSKKDAGRIGFTFSNCTGSGHGAISTSPVKFTVISYTVE